MFVVFVHISMCVCTYLCANMHHTSFTVVQCVVYLLSTSYKSFVYYTHMHSVGSEAGSRSSEVLSGSTGCLAGFKDIPSGGENHSGRHHTRLQPTTAL